jgi:hypothetical protein
LPWFAVAYGAGIVLYFTAEREPALWAAGSLTAQYREALFARFTMDLIGGDVVFVGFSLRDRHLRDAIINAAAAKEQRGAPGHIYAVVFEKNEDRALLLERKDVRVAFGTLDELMQCLIDQPKAVAGAPLADVDLGFRLPEHVYISALEVADAITLPPSASKVFNGSPATYADIRSDLTFKREDESRFKSDFLNAAPLFYVITGVAGVGKTTLARRLLYIGHEQGLMTWEHRDEADFRSSDWTAVEASLREAGKKGLLFIDECLQFARQLSLLAESLAELENASLKLVLTASNAQWARRSKSPMLMRRGVLVTLSKLTPGEIDDLLLLLERQGSIKNLVQNQFSRLTPPEKRSHLRQRCSADMYVCLKNIFAFDSLDTILLREYGELPDDLREIYRHVAALQASGTRVHRQLIIRTLDVRADTVPGVLSQLAGIVDEFDVDPAEGIYGWSTRHLVIATTIASYKFSDEQELYDLLRRVIDSLNPAIQLELRTLRDICNADFGIGRLRSVASQIDLYGRLIRLAPGERIPRHRLISTLLRNDQTEVAGQAIRDAEAAVGLDSPIHRYKVLHTIQRAESTGGILEEDRAAMLSNAEKIALEGLARFRNDKYSYMAYGRVGLALAENLSDTVVLDDAINRMRRATEDLLDTGLDANLRHLEERRRQWNRTLKARSSSIKSS